MASEEEKNRIQRILDRVPGNILVDVLDHLKHQQIRANGRALGAEEPAATEPAVTVTVTAVPDPVLEADSTAVEPEPQPAPVAEKPRTGKKHTSGNPPSRYPGAEEWNDMKDIFG